MKAAVLVACPLATVIDISHSVQPFDLHAAGFVLWAGSRSFPPGTVHLAVVDPGVGTSRRAVALELAGSYYVGPDNGIFTLLVREARPHQPVTVELRRPAAASATFEGRDVFAPAAGALAAGASLKSLGTEGDTLFRLRDPGPRVLWVDHFGNLVTSLKPPVRGIKVRGQVITESAPTYGAAPSGRLFHYVGSMGFVEVAIREGRAANLLGAGPGDSVLAL